MSEELRTLLVWTFIAVGSMALPIYIVWQIWLAARENGAFERNDNSPTLPASGNIERRQDDTTRHDTI